MLYCNIFDLKSKVPHGTYLPYIALRIWSRNTVVFCVFENILWINFGPAGSKANCHYCFVYS
jgi:hypothetical protein